MTARPDLCRAKSPEPPPACRRAGHGTPAAPRPRGRIVQADVPALSHGEAVPTLASLVGYASPVASASKAGERW